MREKIGLGTAAIGLFVIHFGIWISSKTLTWKQARTVIDDMLYGGEIAQSTRHEIDGLANKRCEKV